MKFALLLLALLSSNIAFAYVSPETELQKAVGKDTPAEQDLPITIYEINDHPIKVPLKDGIQLSIELARSDRNSTYKVYEIRHGQRERLRVPNCNPQSKRVPDDLITGSFNVKFINHKGRAFAIQSNGSSGATMVSVSTYKIAVTDFGTEICYQSTVGSEYIYNEKTGQTDLQKMWQLSDY